MSDIHLREAIGLPLVQAEARYVQADHSLIVGPRGKIPVAVHRISIETLTLSFSPDSNVLTGLDAYTNAERWERRSLVESFADREAALECLEPFDEHGIGRSGSGPVRYSYSQESGVLLIELGSGQVVDRIQSLSCLICGLGIGGELLELWVQGLKLDHL
jgi:hypothetical protein